MSKKSAGMFCSCMRGNNSPYQQVAEVCICDWLKWLQTVNTHLQVDYPVRNLVKSLPLPWQLSIIVSFTIMWNAVCQQVPGCATTSAGIFQYARRHALWPFWPTILCAGRKYITYVTVSCGSLNKAERAQTFDCWFTDGGWFNRMTNATMTDDITFKYTTNVLQLLCRLQLIQVIYYCCKKPSG